MLKNVFLLVAVALLASVTAPCAEAAYPSNEQPMYGGIAPTAEQQLANDNLIKQSLALKATPAAASDEFVKLGFDYLLKRQDAATAMKRFNQAYLVDPSNGAAYQGMAITLIIRDQATVEAETLFQRAIASPRVNPGIFSDYGRFLLQTQRPADAISVLQRGVAMDPQYVETGSLLAIALAAVGRTKEACPLAKQWQSQAQPSLVPTMTAIASDPVCQSG